MPFTADGALAPFTDGAALAGWAILPCVLIFLFGSLARQLPWQNVLMVAAILVGMSVLLDFGSRLLVLSPAPERFGPGAMVCHAVRWLVVLLTARGAGRFLLRRSRSAPAYGFHLLGLSVLLALVADQGLDTFAPGPAVAPATWTRVVVVALFAAVSLTACLPWLINKQPGEHPADPRPLLAAGVLALAVAAAAAVQDRWPTAWFSVLLVVVGAVWACYPARWPLRNAHHE